MKFRKRLIIIPLVITFSLFAAAWLLLQFVNLTTYQTFGEIIPRVNTQEKVVALTFDDGPTEYTDEVLSVLNEKEIQATFFMIGKDIEKNASIAAAVVESGHQIGNHSYSHKRNVFRPYAFYVSEVEKTNELIRTAGYTGEIMFRPPYGKKLFGLPYYLSTKNIKTITWDVEPDTYGNWDDPENTAFLVNHTLENVQPGSIIILHPFCNECSDEREALPQIIDGLKEQGYTFVTVEELLKYRE